MNSLTLFKDLITTGNINPFATFNDDDHSRFMEDVFSSGIMHANLTRVEARNLSYLLNSFPIYNLLPFWKKAAMSNTQNTVLIHPHISMRLVEALESHTSKKSA